MSFTLIPPTVGRVTSPFGNRTHPVTGKPMSFHKGIDIAQPGKHNVVAAENGTVHMVVTNPNHWGYGLTVVLRHNGFDTLYAHLDAINVRQGQRVSRGQKVGLQGNTGTSTGQHLHFEVHIPRYESFQPHVKDPLKYISWPGMHSLQRELNKQGYKLTVDGIPGRQTDEAIKDFQRKNGLTVDGIAGTMTLSALAKANQPEEPKKEVIQVSNPKEAPLTAAQEATRQEAMRLGITDGKNARSTPNNHYLWSAMIPLAQKLEQLEKLINESKK